MSAPSKSYRRVTVSLVRETCTPYPRLSKVRDGGDVAALLLALLGEETREVFVAVYLDARHRVIGTHVVSIGSANSSLVHPREVFLPAVHLSATAIVVGHNHPSGDPAPSAQDRQVTERLREGGELLGIQLLDHVIVGERNYFSFASEATTDLTATEEGKKP